MTIDEQHLDGIYETRISTTPISNDIAASLHAQIKRCEEAKEIRVIVIRLSDIPSHGEATGPYPNELQYRQPQGSHGSGPIVIQRTIEMIWNCSKPTIAFLSGQIDGIGIDLAAACDIRIGSCDLLIQDTRIRTGRTAATGITYMLPRLIGHSLSNRMLLLGDRFTADMAMAANFLHDVIPSDQFEDRCLRMSRKIANMPTRAWEVHKKQVIPQLDMSFDAAMTHSLGVRQTHVIKDRIEGIRAWQEKREPRFTGN